MRVALASDHAGFRYKQLLKGALAARGHEVVDFGTHSEDAVDYPVFVRPAAEAVARGECDRAIVLGGSGNGEAIVANRIPGVRCTIGWSVEAARLGRSHNDSNVLSLGQRFLPEDQLAAVLDAWLTTPFDGGRHQRRIALIDTPGTGGGTPSP
jgi:ribose 5-phosphate isomerase B